MLVIMAAAMGVKMTVVAEWMIVATCIFLPVRMGTFVIW